MSSCNRPGFPPEVFHLDILYHVTPNKLVSMWDFFLVSIKDTKSNAHILCFFGIIISPVRVTACFVDLQGFSSVSWDLRLISFQVLGSSSFDKLNNLLTFL